MSAINVLNSAISRIKDITSEIPLDTGYNDLTPYKVYRQVLPELMNDEFDYSEESDGKNLYPFVVVQLAEGEKQSNNAPMKTRVLLLIGVHNEGLESEGYDDVLVCIDSILNDFNETPYVDNRFIIEGPISWSVHEGNTHPFYFGGMEFTLASNTLTDNRGGLRDE